MRSADIPLLKDRVAYALRRAGVSQAELAAACGIAHSAVGQWVNGKTKTIKSKYLVLAARKLKVTEHWLACNIPPMHKGDPGVAEDTALYNAASDSIKVVKVPLISWAQAWKWNEIADQFQPQDAGKWRETTARVGSKAFALEARGDSMSSVTGVSIPEGFIVIVDPSIQAEHGSIVVAHLEESNEAVIKKLVIDGPNKYLKPLNPEYRSIVIDNGCTIVGVVRKIEFDL